MTRSPLPDRHRAETIKVQHTWSHGATTSLIVTCGFDDAGMVRAVFCADFKAGTDMHTLVIDACIALSLLLQHGYTVRELRGKLAAAPQSLLATLINAAAEIENEFWNLVAARTCSIFQRHGR